MFHVDEDGSWRTLLGNAQRKPRKMSGLTGVGIFWALTSLLAAVGASVGFFMPYWLRGSLPDLQDVATYFGVFRRCNFPYESEGKILLREECGRYSSFLDIPSLWWQIGTLTIGVGCCLAVLIAITAVLAICIQDIVSPKIAKVAGVLQLCAALLIGGGVAIYPNGWNSQEVQQACGSTSGPYILGECSLYWAFYVTGSCAGTILIMSFLACHAARRKNGRNNPTDV